LVYVRAGGIFKLGERSTASVVHGGSRTFWDL
jgi:hypothetical protein